MSYSVCKNAAENIFRSLQSNQDMIKKYDYFRIPLYNGYYDSYESEAEYNDVQHMSNKIKQDFKVLAYDCLPTEPYSGIIPEKEKIGRKIFSEYNEKFKLPFKVSFSHFCPAGGVFEFDYYYINIMKNDS